MYDYTVIHVARQEEERRRQQAEIIATVYGGYAPIPPACRAFIPSVFAASAALLHKF